MNSKKSAYKKTDIGLNCPSCGQFMGPFKVCPYCRTKVKNRLDIRTFKAISLVVAVVGIAALLVWANMKDHDKWKVEDLTKRQNYAYLEFNGIVVDDPKYFITFSDEGKALPGSLSFLIDDGTGLLEVKAYAEVAKDIVKEKKIPVQGDRVTVKGPVMFRGDDMSLMLQDESSLVILDEDIDIKITISDIFNTGEDGITTGTIVITPGKMVKLTGTFPGPMAQEDEDYIDFCDNYGNTKILIKDENDNMVVIKIASVLRGPYRVDIDEKEDDEISFSDHENNTDLEITVVGHLIWDKYTYIQGSEHRGSWVIVPRTFDDVWLEVS